MVYNGMVSALMVVKGHGSVTKTSNVTLVLVPGVFSTTVECAYSSRVTVCFILARSVASTVI